MNLIGKLNRVWSLPWLEKTQSATEFFWTLKTRYYYKHFFGRIGINSKIIDPMRLRNVQNINIGANVLINRFSFLLTLQSDVSQIPRLTIDDGCVIGHMNHITSINEVHIGKDVLTADRVYISDHSHGFDDTTIPILRQSAISKGKVRIGDGTWIGENAVILSCEIGRNCVIGSNAVVIEDVPDYSVAVGIPARVVRRFNTDSKIWEKVQSGHRRNSD